MDKFGRKIIPDSALLPDGYENIVASLKGIAPGQTVIYHEGMLSKDRVNSHVDKVADLAYKMATEGRPRVELKQFRLEDNHYAYAATGLKD